MNIKRLKKRRKGSLNNISKKKSADTFKKLVDLSYKYAREGNFEKEESCYRRLLKISPENPDVLNHLGNVLDSQEKLSSALKCYRKVLANNPENIGTYANLGKTLTKTGDIGDAISCFKKVLDKYPNEYIAYSCLLFAMNYQPEGDERSFYLAAKGWWDRYSQIFKQTFNHRKKEKSNRRLRVGYVSPDFRSHSVCYFFLPLLQNHNRNVFKIYCYSDVSTPDAITSQLEKLSDTWRNVVNESHENLAKIIFDDDIDILVDLTGHVSGNRLPVFLLKPAPIQVSWLGYPNTTGLESIAYRFTDEVADPVGEADKYHSEKLLRLPHGFLCYAPPSLPATKISGSRDLSEKITFGSFNNLSKITTPLIKIWSQILNKTPDSTLFLKCSSLADETTKKKLLEAFQENGVEPNRIEMKAWTSSLEEHMALYAKVDVALDTFPYNGTTTTCEALWMNTPVITRYGNRHAARVGGSILTRLGLEELICHTDEEYIEKAVELAGDKTRTNLKFRNLREKMAKSDLCNPELFSKQVENAYKEMIEQIKHTFTDRS